MRYQVSIAEFILNLLFLTDQKLVLGLITAKLGVAILLLVCYPLVELFTLDPNNANGISIYLVPTNSRGDRQ